MINLQSLLKKKNKQKVEKKYYSNIDLENTYTLRFLVYLYEQLYNDGNKAKKVYEEILESRQPAVLYLIRSGIVKEKDLAQILAKYFKLPYKEKIPLEENEKLVIDQSNSCIIDNKSNKYHYLPVEKDVTIIPYSEYRNIYSKYSNFDTSTTVEDAISYMDNILKQAATMDITDVLVNGNGSIYEIAVKLVGGSENGNLLRLAVLSKEEGKKIISSLKARASKFSDVKININDQPQSGKIIFDNLGLEVRIEFLPAVEGESASLRLFNVTGYFNKRLEDLSYPKEFVEIAKQIALKDKGLIIIGGATGSGKSTFMKAMLLEANPAERLIRLVEDPVELRVKGVTQMQTKEGVFNFADAIRSFMRANPDIIGVGEVRDSETAIACLEAAMSGHLTYTTIHANDSITNLERLVLKIVQSGVMSQEEAYSNLSSALLLSINQKLVRLTNGEIRPVLEWFYPDNEERELLKNQKLLELREKLKEKKRDYNSLLLSLKEQGLITEQQYINYSPEGVAI